MPLFNESPYGGEDLAITATEELRKELSRTQELALAPRATAKFVMPSKQIYTSGGAKLLTMARKAKLSGVNFILYGRITNARVRGVSDKIGLFRKSEVYCEAQVEIRVFDVTSGQEIFSEIMHGHSNNNTFRLYTANQGDHLNQRQELLRHTIKIAVRKSIPQIIQLSDKLAWTGRVARVIGAKIYLNSGRESGVRIGDIMKVITEGSEIYDPETGALIGMSKGEVKGTLEVIDYFGPDGSVAILHSGSSIVEGDFVQLY